MIEHLIKYFYQESRLAKATLLLSLFAFSCSDQGCIDADDFGEYESQTIEVTANSAQSDCKYDITKPLNDIDAQGERVKLCFISGEKSVTNENGETQTVAQNANPAGCDGFSDASFRNLCINQCVQECIMNSASNSSNAEPNWTSTTKRSTSINDGVTIAPGAQIVITANGNISLGDSATYPNIYVQADRNTPHTSTNTWSDFIFDVRANQSLDVKFSGKWASTADGNEYGTTTTGLSASGVDANDVKIYNGARRAAAFLIPHPSGYGLNPQETDERLAVKGVPLLPDRTVWTCSYANDGSATCTSGDYVAAGYSNVSNDFTASTFPISAEVETFNFAKYGGMIRWANDGIKADSDDLFADNSVTCDLPDPCKYIDRVPATSGQIVGDAVNSNIEIVNPSQTDSYKVSFKNLSPEAACNNIADFRIWIKDSVGNALDNGGGTDGKQINFDQTHWSSDHISLEPNQKIVFNKFGTPSINCGKGIAVKFSKYKDITIQQSGLVSFKMLGTGSGTCSLKGRIINPGDDTTRSSHSTATFGPNGAIAGYSADFYEHENFLSTSPTDPLSNLPVTSTNWSESIFVRKGQVLRFSPESWNDDWNPTGLTAKCGTGMAMSILPRPALLCRGRANDLISNPNCIPEYATVNGASVLIGCQAVASECNDENNTGSFCPISNCQKTITCTTPAGTSPYYQKSGCTADGTITTSCPDPSDTACQSKLCTYNTTTSPNITSTTCASCDSLRAAYASYAAKSELPSADQCYDLENYKGKVANINIDTGFSSDDLADPNRAKGATKLTAFNGSYGNLESFSQTTETDATTSNKIFKLSSPAIFTQNGRLRFFLLDGNSFNGPVAAPYTGGVQNAYDDNSSHGANYNGANGLKISTSGMLSFSNGQWMEIKLCKESTDTSSDCRKDILSTSSLFDDDDEQPHIIDITPPTSSAESASTPTISSPYKFDSSGNLIRTGGTLANDCDTSIPNSYFYCHKYNYFTKSDLESKSENEKSTINDNISKLRLTFKILDPEIANCDQSDPTSNIAANFDGVILNNSYYASPDPTNPSDPNNVNVGKICDSGEVPGLEVGQCQKQFYCAGKYVNNSGSYFVNVKVKNSGPSTVSSLIGGVITPIIQVMDGDGLLRDCSSTGSTNLTDFDGVKTNNPLYDNKNSEMKDKVCLANEENCEKQYYCRIANSVGQAERIYRALISDTRYKAIVTMCIVVMFTFYGVGFLMGVSELNHSEIINRIIKIGLIYLFIGEAGWEWFDKIVVGFFKRSTDELAFLMASSFDDSAELSSAMTSGNYYDKSILFGSVDNVFNMFFSPSVQKKISALLFASIFGWLYMLIIYWGFMLYVGAVANAVLLYLTAQVFISILFTLGPIFFVFTLFSQTKDMFDNWLKQLISFSLQQIFLLTTLAFFNMLMYEVIKLSLGYKICWAEVWSINIITHISLMSFWTISSLPPRTNAQSSVGNIGNPEGIPSLFSILFIYVIASLMDKFVNFMTDVAASIGGGLKASAMGAGIKAAVNEVGTALKAKAGEAFTKVGGQDLINRMDDKLFDSGTIADKRRQESKEKNKTMSENKSALDKAGKDAVRDHKKKNGAELAAMSAEDQKKELNKVRSQAMDAAGEKRGLDEKAIAAVKADKGFKYEGTNLAVGAFEYAKSLRGKSLDEQSANTSFSNSEWKAAMKNTDNAGRAKMIEARKEGNIDVKRSTSGQVLQALGNAKKSAASAASKTKKAATSTASAVSSAGTSAISAIGGAGTSAISAVGSAASSAKTLATSAEARQAAVDNLKQGASEAAKSVFTEEGRKNAAASTASALSSAASSATSSATKGAKLAASAAKAATGAAAQAAKKVATKALSKSEEQKNYEEAERQLVDEGEIDQMRTGTAWAGSDERKAAIKARSALNKAQKAVDIKKPDAGSIADMELEREYLEAKENISEDDPLTKQMAERFDAFAKKMNPLSDNKKDKMNAAADAAHAKTRGKVASDLEVAKEEHKNSKQDLQTANNEFLETAKAVSANPEAQAIRKAQEAVKNAGSKSEKKDAEKALKKLEKNKSPELRKLEKAQQAAYASQLKARTKSENLGEKVNKLKAIGASMDKAKAIKDKALVAVEPKEDAPDNTTQRDPENSQHNDALDDNQSEAPKTKAQAKISELRADAEEKAAEKKDNSSTEDTTNQQNNSKQSTRDKAFGRILDQVKNMPAAREAKKAKKDLEKFDSDEGKKIASKANSIIENAESVKGMANANTESYEHKDAVKTLAEFAEIESFDDLQKFVEEREEKTVNLLDEFDDLKSPEDFEKFNSKYKTAEQLEPVKEQQPEKKDNS